MATATFDMNDLKRRMQGAIADVLCGKGNFTIVG